VNQGGEVGTGRPRTRKKKVGGEGRGENAVLMPHEPGEKSSIKREVKAGKRT